MIRRFMPVLSILILIIFFVIPAQAQRFDQFVRTILKCIDLFTQIQLDNQIKHMNPFFSTWGSIQELSPSIPLSKSIWFPYLFCVGDTFILFIEMIIFCVFI